MEGELDMIPSYQAGVKEVVAIKGSAFTDEQARLISRYTKNVLFALDADSAGQEAIKRAVNVADPYDLSIRVVQITGGKDPGDVATENPTKWREMVAASVLFYDFLIESSCKRIAPGSGEGAKQISAEVVPVLSDISNRVVQAHYVGVLAKRLSIPESMVYEEIERRKKKKELKILSETVRSIEQSPASRREKVEQYILSILLQHPELPKEEISDKVFELFATPAIAKVVDKLVTETTKFEIGAFAKSVAPELRPVVDEAYLRDLSEITTRDEAIRELHSSLLELSSLALKEGMKKLTPQIAAAELAGDKDKLVELQDQFVRLSKRLNSTIIPS